MHLYMGGEREHEAGSCILSLLNNKSASWVRAKRLMKGPDIKSFNNKLKLLNLDYHLADIYYTVPLQCVILFSSLGYFPGWFSIQGGLLGKNSTPFFMRTAVSFDILWICHSWFTSLLLRCLRSRHELHTHTCKICQKWKKPFTDLKITMILKLHNSMFTCQQRQM